jgi:hypothetical protein
MMNNHAKTVLPLNEEEAELLSLDYFLQHTATFTNQKPYPELQQALIDYHQASTLPQFAKQAAVLKQQIASVMSHDSKKSSDYLRRLRNHLNNVQLAITRYEDEPIEQLPFLLHFICIGQPFTQSQQQPLALWKAVQETSGASLILWYDSDALWVETLNQCMLEAALKQSFQQQPNSSSPVFLNQLNQNLSVLREIAYNEIQQALAVDRSADAVRKQILLTRYQQSEEFFTTRLKEHQQLIEQLIVSGITVCDIHSRLENGPLAQPYQRELLQRGHLPAATQIASLRILQQAGGIYSANNALPPLSDSFWSDVTQHYLQQQGLTQVDPQQLEKSMATLRQQWLADGKIQVMTWQRLWQHNPEWKSMIIEADQAFSGHETPECSALLQAIDSTAQSSPLLSSIFQPIKPLAMQRHQWVVIESTLGQSNPLLLAAHQNSKLLQAVIRQVQTHYQILEQLEQRLHDQHKPLQDREARIEIAECLELSPRLACAVVDYPVEGFSIGADTTRELSGIGALRRGVERYNATQLLPSKLLKNIQNVFLSEQINQWVHPNDFRPFSQPLGSEQTAQIWYQQSKALWAQQSKVDGEQPRLNLLDLIADQPIKPILPEVAGQYGRGLIRSLKKLVNSLLQDSQLTELSLGFRLATSLVMRVIRSVQLQVKMSSYTATTCLQQVRMMVSIILGMNQPKDIISEVQQSQLDQINNCMRTINRRLLKGALRNEIDTVIHSEIMLQSDPIEEKLSLVNRPQKLDVSTGINDVTLPEGNFMSHQDAPHKSVLFNLGDGDHQAIGVLNKPNQFLLGEGWQSFTGGNQHNFFILSLSAEALQRQMDLAMEQGLPLYRLAGGEGANRLIIQSELPPSSTDKYLEPHYIGYYVDLNQGRVWLRQHNPADPEHPQDQALLLMTLRNINQLEIRSVIPTHSVISGSDEANTLILHRQDTLYTGRAHDTLIIQGGATIHSQSGGKRYVISDQVNQLGEVEINIIEAPTAALSTIHLPVDHDQLTEWRLVDNDLIVGLGQQPQSCQLILKGVYQTVNNQRSLAREQWRLFTHDGLQLLPQWPAVVSVETSPAINFTAYYAKIWDQRTAAAAVISSSAGYQLQPTPPEYLTAPEAAMSARFIEDLSAVSDEANGSALLPDRSWVPPVHPLATHAGIVESIIEPHGKVDA